MSRPLRSSLLVLSATAFLAAGCGGDDEETDAAGGAAAPAQTAPAPTGPAPDEEAVRDLIAKIDEKPERLCDPKNITAALLEQIGGEEACREASEGQKSGGEYEIEDVAIQGGTATAIILEGDVATAVTFVTEDGRVKVAAQGPAQAPAPETAPPSEDGSSEGGSTEGGSTGGGE